MLNSWPTPDRSCVKVMFIKHDHSQIFEDKRGDTVAWQKIITLFDVWNEQIK